MPTTPTDSADRPVNRGDRVLNAVSNVLGPLSGVFLIALTVWTIHHEATAPAVRLATSERGTELQRRSTCRSRPK